MSSSSSSSSLKEKQRLVETKRFLQCYSSEQRSWDDLPDYIIFEYARTLKRELLKKVGVAHSGYQLFQIEHRQKCKAQNPTDQNGVINHKLSLMWNELTEEEKDVYRQRGKAEKDAQERAIQQFKIREA
jgi:hypothetical protein